MPAGISGSSWEMGGGGEWKETLGLSVTTYSQVLILLCKSSVTLTYLPNLSRSHFYYFQNQGNSTYLTGW